jgi:hypothetical protein
MEEKKNLGEKKWKKKNCDSTIKIDEEETRDSAKRKKSVFVGNKQS